MNALTKLNGWKRLWLLLAAIWLIPVGVFTFTELPRENESDIKARWANDIVNLQKNHHGGGESLAAYRQRVYGNRSDDDIIHPPHTEGGHFDFSTAVPAEEIEQINQRYEAALQERERASPSKTLLVGFFAWAVPLLVLYVFALGVHWVYVGFKNSSK
jgi:broad specificity phosphatase PhoE